ncbi:hypothetical protein VKT23_018860 [Stygiomarasmius scandens]|uniref:Uncharacterized protein n=1 Tax=Marasmiellus scandens TaxID=2682957 RepID=A0ABR1IR54_9AGAR
MELRPQRGRDSYLTLRVPTQACRFLRTHHPYKRVLCIENSPLQPRIDLFGEDVDRFLVADPWLPLHRPQRELQLPHHSQQNTRQTHSENFDIIGAEQ